jgi:hypothetical protein
MRSAIVALSLSLLCALPALADPYLIDPTGGTPLAFTDNDNGTRPVARPLGFTFNFFNESLTGLHPGVNGALAWTGAQGSTTGNGGFDTGGLPVGTVRRIAPFWDDLLLLDPTNGGTDSILEKRANTGGSIYYSVTWSVHKFGQTTAVGPTMEFQTVLFGGAQSVRGFSFLADDIAFSYKTLASPQGGFATAGLQEGSGTNRVAVPPAATGADAFGRYTSSSSIPIHNTTNQFILFRRNSGTGDYTVTLETLTSAAVPEPGSLALLGLGGALLALRFRRPRRNIAEN